MKHSSLVPHKRPGSSRRQAVRLLASLAVALPLSGFVARAPAQTLRQFPADARFGEFEIVRYPDATIDGQALRLAAGAQIRDTRNMIVLPASMSGRHLALYRLDPTGQLSRVWLLTPDEVAAAKARPSAR